MREGQEELVQAVDERWIGLVEGKGMSTIAVERTLGLGFTRLILLFPDTLASVNSIEEQNSI